MEDSSSEENGRSSPPTAEDANTRAAAIAMRRYTCVDCADRAVWSVSTAKHGCGVLNLLDWTNTSTFWQSDGLVPHTITLQFRELTPIASVDILTNQEDESYAPKKVELRGGVQDGALTTIHARELPRGWCKMYAWSKAGWGEPEAPTALVGNLDEDEDEEEEEDPRDQFFWCTTLQLQVLENHSRGRDCRIRAMRVHAAQI